MTFAAKEKSSELDYTISMLELLNDTELQAIQSVARIFIANPNVARPYQPMSEDQLLARIDTALEHIDAGLCQDAEVVEKELAAEFGL